MRKPVQCLLAGLLLTATILLAAPAGAQAQFGTTYFLTYKTGLQDPSITGDTLFKDLENEHGPAKGDRMLAPWALEIDVYALDSGAFASGLGVEVVRGVETYHFQDGTRVHQVIKGVNYFLKTFWRLGLLQPYMGLGVGNYYLNYQESGTNAIALRDSPHNVFSTRLGTRFLGGRWGTIVEYGRTTAMLQVNRVTGSSRVELGGEYLFLGGFLAW